MHLFLRLPQLLRKVLTAFTTKFLELFPSDPDLNISLVPKAVHVCPDIHNALFNPHTGKTGAYITFKPHFMQRHLRLLATGVAVLLLILISSYSFGQATVTSDQPDYAPRSTAVFTGAGFQPGETVQLKVKNLDRPCNTVSADSSYLPWTVVADEDGGFVTNWIVCDCPGDSLRLKATGQTSGLIAYAYFTDASINSVTIGTQTGTLNYGTGGQVTYSFTVTASNANNGTSTITMSTSLPGDITPSFNAASYSLPRNGSFSGTLTLTTTNATQVPTPATFTITASGASNGSMTSSPTGIVINKRSLTPAISVANKIYDGTTTASYTPSFTNPANIVAGDNVSFTAAIVFPSPSANVNPYTLTSTSLTLTGTSAGNYTLSPTTVSTTATISKRSVTPSLVAANKVYNGNTQATGTLSLNNSTGGSDGVISGDNVSATALPANINFADKNVGTKTVTATGLTLGGSSSSNYILTSASATDDADITAKTITVTGITVVSKIYDKTPAATLDVSAANLVGVITSPADVVFVDPVGYTALFGNVTMGSNVSVTVTGLGLQGADAGNYILTQPTGLKGSILRRAVTPSIVANNKVYNATTLATLSSQTLNQATGSSTDGVISGDNVNLNTVPANINFANLNVGTWSVTATGLTLGGSDASNYTLNGVTSATDNAADITQRPITINVNSGQNKVYGNNDPVFLYTFTPTSATPAQGLAGARCIFRRTIREPEKMSVPYDIQITGLTIKNGATNVTSNYDIDYNGATFEITTKPVSVTVNGSQSKIYGSNDPVFTYTSSPAVGSSLPNGQTISFTGALARAPGENVGNSYAINQGSLDNTNYNISFTGANFSITQLNVSVTVRRRTKQNIW